MRLLSIRLVIAPACLALAALGAGCDAPTAAARPTESAAPAQDVAAAPTDYALEGVVRDFSNSDLTNVDLQLEPIDGTAPAKRILKATSRNGEFRFFPVTAGRYRLRATLPHHRAIERQLDVPSQGPLTLVLLADAAI